MFFRDAVIALCGQRQSLALAMELVAEMRGRGIACNVHTYSALMNTCIKCGELEVALDVFEQLKVGFPTSTCKAAALTETLAEIPRRTMPGLIMHAIRQMIGRKNLRHSSHRSKV